MNKIFKIIKNRSGKYTVTSELAKNNTGKVITAAITLFSTMAVTSNAYATDTDKIGVSSDYAVFQTVSPDTDKIDVSGNSEVLQTVIAPNPNPSVVLGEDGDLDPSDYGVRCLPPRPKPPKPPKPVSVYVEAGRNIDVTHGVGKVTIATKNDVNFHSVSADKIVLNAKYGTPAKIIDAKWVADVSSSLGTGIIFADDKGHTKSVKLGQTIKFASTDSNISAKLNPATSTFDFGLAKTINVDKVEVGGISIDKDKGINAGGKVITNVGQGTGDTDAVTHGQVTEMINNVVTTGGIGSWLLATNDGKGSIVKANDKVNFNNGTNIAVTQTGNTINVATTPDVVFSQVTIGEPGKDGIVINKDTIEFHDGKDGKDGVVGSIGKDGIKGKDGTTLSLDTLASLDKSIKAIDTGIVFTDGEYEKGVKLGETIKFSSVDDNVLAKLNPTTGAFDFSLAKTINVDKVEVGGISIDKDAGIDAGGKVITNLGQGTGDTDAVTHGQVTQLIEKYTKDNGTGSGVAPWKFSVNGDESDLSSIGAGDVVNFNSGKNIAITKNGNSINVATAAKVDFEEVFVGEPGKDGKDGRNGVAINGKDGSIVFYDGKDGEAGSIGKDGIKGKDGTTLSLDTLASLDKSIKAIDTGIVFTDGENQKGVKLGETIKFSSKDNNITTQLDPTTGTFNFGLANTISIDKLIAGGISIDKDTGINAGGKTITNLAHAVTDSDAVSYKQVYEVLAGAGITIPENPGDVISPPDNDPDNPNNPDKPNPNDGSVIGEWNLAVNGKDASPVANGDTVNFKAGNNITISKSGNDILIASNGVGGSGSGTFNEIHVSGVTIDENGIDAGDKPISNVADGVDPHDAVNVGQLNAVSDKIDGIEKNSSAGSASSMAIAGLPQSSAPGEFMLNAGLGYYDKQSAVAVGFGATSDSGKLMLRGGVSVNTQKKAGANVGVGFAW